MLPNLTKIVLLTSGQPTLNPRLVKEADALTSAGYDVTVIYQFWNEWASQYDKNLLARKKWKAIMVGGSPRKNRLIFWQTRIIHKIFRTLNKYIATDLFPELSIGRCTYQLYKKALSVKADIYIAHNLPALPVAFRAAKKINAKCGFDAEDFHRFENSDDINHPMVKLNSLIEEKYMPLVNYITAASPLIKKAYQNIFNRQITTILNVMENNDETIKKTNHDRNLRLFWFSQTIGENRGLENVISAINQSVYKYELHLLGEISQNYRLELLNLIDETNGSIIHFHNPIDQDEIISFASDFDIGLASEPGFSTNNNFALSNKIFTYIQAKLTVVASNTPAQSLFLNQNDKIGKIYDSNDLKSLVQILDFYQCNRGELDTSKIKLSELATEAFNWAIESKKFLSIINTVLNH
ncbi:MULTISPECIES: glycosyltransferase family 4 protein [unclassified Pedobacter]|uniref:glycosyltransferase family 4 protein n=1 Tax=unclassified Pedobacter TaxID=2628915 RepID=UPI001423D98C|nr:MULTISPECIES: glycosyltransferase family 4 protein [unclassified Pedobacter]NII81327.1 glycosyltransferase involved in cell wall biosynthesis [Pedobacter sp. SG908]NMN35333.1 glycosyltransferase involved in cell wall biosynthesis [Pedobacter sp. SG918]